MEKKNIVELAKELKDYPEEPLETSNKNEPSIFFKKDDPRAIIPICSYGNTSACFDIIAIEKTIIPARGHNFVPNGLKVIIPEGWFLEFADRSGNGINKNLKIHQGIIDPGYTGPLAIKVYNMGDEDQVIEEGKGVCQVKVMKKWDITILEATDEQWEKYCKESIRKSNGFGSTDNNKKG